MGPAPVRSEESGAALTPQRAAVLEHLQHQAEPLTRFEVATHLGLHPNTAREHLEALVFRGMAERFGAPPRGRGRPSWCYRAAIDRSEPDVRVQDYTGLAVALANHLARTSDDPAAAAVEAGAEWARNPGFDLPKPDRGSRGSTIRATRLIRDQLSALGFAPEIVRSEPHPIIHLPRCPLLDAAHRNPTVVCNVHLGLVRGLLADAGCDLQADLQSFARPGACVLELRPAEAE